MSSLRSELRVEDSRTIKERGIKFFLFTPTLPRQKGEGGKRNFKYLWLEFDGKIQSEEDDLKDGKCPGGFNLRFHPYFIPLQPSATSVGGGIRRIAFRFLP